MMIDKADLPCSRASSENCRTSIHPNEQINLHFTGNYDSITSFWSPYLHSLVRVIVSGKQRLQAHTASAQGQTAQ